MCFYEIDKERNLVEKVKKNTIRRKYELIMIFFVIFILDDK